MSEWASDRLRAPVALVMGFGPFGSVVHNPATDLAQRLDGRATTDGTIVGRVMPVSYRRAVEVTAQAVARFRPWVVLGVGVAADRDFVALEAVAHATWRADLLDVDGCVPSWRPGGRARSARLPVESLSRTAKIRVSQDCGSYVCNAWFYTMLGALPERLSVGFLHIPSQGWTPDGVVDMLNHLSKVESNRD